MAKKMEESVVSFQFGKILSVIFLKTKRKCDLFLSRSRFLAIRIPELCTMGLLDQIWVCRYDQINYSHYLFLQCAQALKSENTLTTLVFPGLA